MLLRLAGRDTLRSGSFLRPAGRDSLQPSATSGLRSGSFLYIAWQDSLRVAPLSFPRNKFWKFINPRGGGSRLKADPSLEVGEEAELGLGSR